MKFLLVLLFWLSVAATAFVVRQLHCADSEQYWRAWWGGFSQNWTRWFTNDLPPSFEPVDYAGYQGGSSWRWAAQIGVVALGIVSAFCFVVGTFVWSLL